MTGTFETNKPIQFQQHTSGSRDTIDGSVIVEAPVSITVNGDVWLTFMCTPADLEALAVGFLFNEGLVQSKEEIVQVRVCSTGDNIDVWLDHKVEQPEGWRRTSGCTGGMTSVEENPQEDDLPVIPISLDGFTLTSKQIAHLVDQLFEAQDLYRQSGGVHSSGLSDGDQLLVVAEDIGRHNTLDKIAGRCLLEGIFPSRRVLLTTGRISSEMVQKAARLGAAVLISRTAVSSLAIQSAEKAGITLIGYARRNRYSVYTYPNRIILD